MAIKIELLSISPSNASVALYYPIASPIAVAKDTTRTAAGIRWSGQELQDLKDGTLFELVKNISINRLNKLETKVYIEDLWIKHQTEALGAYKALYRDVALIGKAFDGTSWS